MKPFISITIITVALSLGGAATIRGQEIPDGGSLPDVQQGAPKSEAETQKAQAEAQRLQAELQGAQDAGQKAQAEWDQQHPRGGVPAYGGGGGGGGGGATFGGSGGAGAVYTDRLQGMVRRADGSSGKALVIRSSDTDPKDQAKLEEDLAVMSHILDKTLSERSGAEARPWKAMGIDVFLPGSTPFRSLFLDGYGALFMLKVNFPLLPPAAKTEEPKEKSPVDSTWEEAREELYGQHSEGQFAMGAVEEYSAEKVNKLKEGLLEALKSAANIRELKSDDSITVCVFGGPSAAPVKYRATSRRAPAPARGSYEAVAAAHSASPMRGTIMTLRVKKSDADAFAHGNLKLDEFRKKARITIYAGGDTSGGSVSWFGAGN